MWVITYIRQRDKQRKTAAEPVKNKSRMRSKCGLNHTSDRKTNTDKQPRTETHELLTRAEPRVLIFTHLELTAFTL